YFVPGEQPALAVRAMVVAAAKANVSDQADKLLRPIAHELGGFLAVRTAYAPRQSAPTDRYLLRQPVVNQSQVTRGRSSQTAPAGRLPCIPSLRRLPRRRSQRRRVSR